MRLLLIAVGRLKSGPLKALGQHYAQRLVPPPAIREVEERRPLPAAERKEREAALLLDALPKGATAVALDASGKTLTSEDFARRLAGWRQASVGDLARRPIAAERMITWFSGSLSTCATWRRSSCSHCPAVSTTTWPCSST